MPGRGSYGPGGKWIHDRAHHIMGKNPEMPKGMAYAVATQQAHKVGKSPKGFRTKEGVREAKAKMTLPREMYKKKAAAQKLAFDRLKALQKEAAASKSKRVVKFRSGGDVRRMPTVRGEAKVRPRAQRRVVHVPPGMEAVPRGRVERRLVGGRSPVRVMMRQPPKPKLIERLGTEIAGRIGGGIADRIRYGGLAKARPMPIIPSATQAAAPMASVAQAGSPLLKNPKLLKALKFSGLGAAGLGLGAVGHGLAQSVGLTETGPADTIADILVPGVKTSYDRVATRALERSEMYIPRYYLEKAAAEMAGAVEDNAGTMFTADPGMHGPEASVIPQQTLETVVPVRQHVEKADDEEADILSRMFEQYKKTSEESIGRYTKGETEIPLAKQAGRLAID